MSLLDDKWKDENITNQILYDYFKSDDHVDEANTWDYHCHEIVNTRYKLRSEDLDPLICWSELKKVNITVRQFEKHWNSNLFTE